ncbi:MAG TPA: hypothetical protein VL371_23070 [Gemmataceae bacterium]|jgi:hypothetical protein|nr:hypothetical protein [Gemmataceae bacterium]
MVRKTIDQMTRIKLLGCLEELELCDESGQVIGRLIPDPAYRRMMYDRANALFTDEEIDEARKRKGPGKSLAEIMRSLESMNGPVHSDVAPHDGTAPG